MFLSYLKADFLKTKHLAIRKAHLFIPIVMTAFFIAYYSYSPWSEYVKTDAFYQVQGMGMPFLIGLFCAMSAEQEQAADACQSMLMAAVKPVPFLSKLIMLLLFGIGSLLMTSILFMPAFYVGLGNTSIKIIFFLIVPFLIWIGSIPLYVLHLYLAFRFSKGVTIGLGIAESLVSALFLTDMGNLVWGYVPAAWSARMATTFLAAYSGDSVASTALNEKFPFCLLSGMILFALYLNWAYRFEGTKSAD